MCSKSFHRRFLAAVFPLVLSVSSASAQTTVFTYQGKLSDGASPAGGNYDMQFNLFDTATVGAGVRKGPTITNPSVPVTAGIFSVQLDFGLSAFNGQPRYLEIGVRPSGSPDPYTVLSPRQQVTSTPYSVRSLNSSVADVLSSACLGCVTSTQVGSVSGSAVTGTIPVASMPAGSGNYVQNTTSQQAASNFSISGDGTVGGTLSGAVVNAAMQYNIAGGRVLSAAGTANLFAGYNSGTNNTGSNNSFFGPAAGAQNTTGGSNSYFGAQAGASNTTNGDNSFFGYHAGFQTIAGFNSFFGSGAGENNTTSGGNAFFGYNAGTLNTAGNNSFFGSGTGENNTTGVNNSFFGYNAGSANLSGGWNSYFGFLTGGLTAAANSNSFFGAFAGTLNTTGANNVFIGYEAGSANSQGSYNTIIGHTANVNTTNLNHATAIGAEAVVSTSNTIALGRSDGSDLVEVYGRLQLDTLGPATTNLCFNSANRIGTCSSSLRYKTAVKPFVGGLDIVRRLRPITFNWIDGGMSDVGFGAEEVEKIAPLLTTHNATGEIEGVKYGQITTVLVNAIQQQQSQIAAQQHTIEQQQQQLKQQNSLVAGLKNLVCRKHARAAVCK